MSTGSWSCVGPRKQTRMQCGGCTDRAAWAPGARYTIIHHRPSPVHYRTSFFRCLLHENGLIASPNYKGDTNLSFYWYGFQSLYFLTFFHFHPVFRLLLGLASLYLLPAARASGWPPLSRMTHSANITFIPPRFYTHTWTYKSLHLWEEKSQENTSFCVYL